MESIERVNGLEKVTAYRKYVPAGRETSGSCTWRRAVDWLNDNFPNGERKDKQIRLLEECCRLFVAEKSMHQQAEYLKAWVSYVSTHMLATLS